MAVRRRTQPGVFGATTTYGGSTGADTYAPPTSTLPNTGVSGYADPSMPPPVVKPKPVPTPTGPVETEQHPNGPEPGPAKTYAVEANQAKLGDPNHQSAMYRMLRTLSGYDPTKGLKQAGLLDSLNALGLGRFEAADDDELRILDPSDEWEGVTEWDVIKGFDTGNGVWAGQGLNGKAANVGVSPLAPSPTPTTGAGAGAGSAGSGPGMPTIAPEYLAMLEDLFRQSGQEYGGPQDAGVFPSDVGVQQVGQDPLSELVTGGLASLIQSGGAGYSALNDDVDRALEGLLDPSTGGLNERVINARMESAREHADRSRMAATDTLKSQLAARNLLGSGPERTGLERVAEGFNADMATSLRDIFADEAEGADARFMQSLGLAKGMAGDQTRTLLDTLGEATDRQQVLSNIAFDTLDRNMAWNQFLAQFGLERDQVMNEIRQGRIEGLIPLLQMFMTSAGISSRGYV
jgi:hypothetical protein